jgi:uncharacterized membrane protein YeaQ/YmgE (transglycosylase-associated protein family)
MEIVGWLIVLFLCGVVASMIADSKNRSRRGWFVGGIMLGHIGILIVACLPIINKKCTCGEDCRCDDNNGENI